MTSHSWESRVVPTSLPLHVVEIGEEGVGRAPVFVFLHGYGGSSFMWRHWAGPLSERGRVLLVDLKGFGAAPKPDDDRYTPDDLADLAVHLLSELDLRQVTLVGQSLGGGIALLAALKLRDAGENRLDRLVLLAPAAYRQKLPPLVPLSRRPRLSSVLLSLVGARRTVRWVLRSIVHDPATVTDDQVEAYARPLATPEGRSAAFAVGRSILPEDLENRVRRYPELDHPTLLLWGSSDRVIPLWVGRRLEEELPDARLVILERCGHLACEERPRASLAVVEEFLDATR